MIFCMTETSDPKKRGRPATGHGDVTSVRVPEIVKEAFDAAAGAVGSNRSAKTAELWAWFARVPGAKLPKRPEQPEAP